MANCGWHRFFRDARVVRHESAIRQLRNHDRFCDSLFYWARADQRKSYVDQPRLDRTIENVQALQTALSAIDGLTVSPRVQAFAVVSMGEKSLGGMVVGVDFATEQKHLDIYSNVIDGTVPTQTDQALIGASMSRNLGAVVGDELVVLGSGKQGAVAAAIFVVSGIVETGQDALDRTLVFAPFAGVAETLYLQDEAHMLLLMVDDLSQLGAIATQINPLLPEQLTLQTWQQLMPLIEQSIEMDKAGGYLFFSMLLILVTFAVVNTFVMVLYERTREFGLFMALGMRPWQVIGQVQFEALLLSSVGVALGLGLSYPLIDYLTGVGIPVNQIGGEEAIQQMQMGTMDRIYPRVTWSSMATAPLVMMIGTQLAALVSTVRVRSINPVTALRVE